MPVRLKCNHPGCEVLTYSKYCMCAKHSNAAAQRASREFKRISAQERWKAKQMHDEVEKLVDEILSGPPIVSKEALRRQQDQMDCVEFLMAKRDKIGPL